MNIKLQNTSLRKFITVHLFANTIVQKIRWGLFFFKKGKHLAVFNTDNINKKNSLSNNLAY